MPRHHRLVGMLGLSALLLVVLGTPRAAAAGSDDSPAEIRPTLAGQTSFVEHDGLFELELDTTEVPADARVEVVVRDRVLSRSEFGLSVTGDRLRATRFSLPPRPFTEIDGFATGRARFEIRVGQGEGQARLTREGVYPVEVRIFDADGVRIGGVVTHLVLLPDASEEPRPLAVALVSEIGLDPATAPDGSSITPPPETRDLARLIEVLAAHPDVPLSIAARPETVEAFAISEDPDATAALLALRDAIPGRQVVALPYVDVDVAALIAAGLDDELDRQLRRGEQILRAELDVEPESSIWLAEPTLDVAATEALIQRGRDSFVVDEGRVAPIDQGNGLSLTRRFGLAVPGPPPAATKTDPVLGFRLLDSVDPALAAHTVLAELAVISLEEPSSSRGVVIRPPDGPLPPVETLEIMLDALTTPNALVTPVTLDQFFGQVEPLTELEAELTPEPHDNLSTYARELRETRRLLESYASMAGSSEQSAPFEQLLMIGAARGLSPAERSDYLAAARDGVTDQLGAVTISDARTITLTARTGSVPLTLRNDSGIPLHVLVTLDSERLEFPDGEVLDLVLTEEVTRVDVAVNTRTSGSFPLRIDVQSPDGLLELAATRVTIRSTAVSGVGIILSVGALVILVLWWLRDWRSGRRDRRLVERRTADRDADAHPSPA